MAQERSRDRVWKYALAGAIRNGNAVKPQQIAEAADVSERTARECLNVIADAGWLKRDLLPDGSVRFLEVSQVEWNDDYPEDISQ